MPVRYKSEDLAGKFLCKQDGAFRLAAGAEIPRAARIFQEMLFPAFGAANAREASREPPTRKELLDRAHDRGAQRPPLRLEWFFVGADVTGYSKESGFTCGSYAEAQPKKKVISKASRVIMPMDTSQIGCVFAFTFSTLKEVGVLVTEVDPGEAKIDGITKSNFEIY